MRAFVMRVFARDERERATEVDANANANANALALDGRPRDDGRERRCGTKTDDDDEGDVEGKPPGYERRREMTQKQTNKRMKRDAIASHYVEDDERGTNVKANACAVEVEDWEEVMRTEGERASEETMNAKEATSNGSNAGAWRGAIIGRGLRANKYIEKGEVVMELAGPRLITAQRCAKEEKTLEELVRYWLIVQSSSMVQTLVSRDILRQWRRAEMLWHHAPWAKDEDFVGDGYVPNPTAKRMIHLPLDETVLSCFLALERRKEKESKWHDYISKLPTLEEFRKDIPLMIPLRSFVLMFGYTECEKAHTRKMHSDATLRQMIAERRRIERTTELTFRHIVSKVSFREHSTANRFTFDRTHMTREEFLWGYAVVMTRGFKSPSEPSTDPWFDMMRRVDFVGTFLAPYLDFANQKILPEIEYVVSDGMRGEGLVTVRALKSFSEGEFMHTSYRDPSGNTDLFMRCGFCEANNVDADGYSKDMFLVDLDDLVRWYRDVPTDVINVHQDMYLRIASTSAAYNALSMLLRCVRPCVCLSNGRIQGASEASERSMRAIYVSANNRCGDAKNDINDVAVDNGDLDGVISSVWGSFESHDNSTIVPKLAKRPKFSPEFAAIMRDVEVKSLRAVSEWLLKLTNSPLKISPTIDVAREKLSHAHEIMRQSRQRVFDFYALAASAAADELELCLASARRRRRPSHVIKSATSRRVGDDVFHSAVADLARVVVERFDSVS